MAKTYNSPFTIEIPTVDLVTFVFSARNSKSKCQPQYFDANNPSRCFSLEMAQVIVKRLAKGLLDLGLKADDKVLLYSGNNLYFPILFWGTVASGCVFTGCSPSASVAGKPPMSPSVPLTDLSFTSSIKRYMTPLIDLLQSSRISYPTLGRKY
jgi:acyl-CoA synthetase (AMP-forming)/AMP-acid ligase II